MKLRALTFGLMALASAAAAADPTLVEARRNKSDPNLAMLTYQHLDDLFDTQTVKAGARPSRLSRSATSLDAFTYTFEDKTYQWSDFFERTRANAVLVLKDGKVVSEVYRNGSDASTRFIVYSMSKSVVSMLTGIAIADGLIGLDDAVTTHIPELKGSSYDGVTIRHLLEMRSGVKWSEAYAPGSELDKVRDASLNQATAYYEDYAFKAERAADPGAKFNYSTLETGVLGWALERAIKRPVPEYMSEKLWKPAGMESDGYWVLEGPEGKQRPWFGAGFNATLRDFGRLGQLMLDGGKANGRQIIPAAWVKESSTDSDKSGYMYLWWPLRGGEGFSARGTYGQAMYVQPASRTVMVVMSYWPGAGSQQMNREQNEVFSQVEKALGGP
jgi:CubicO group peptidase (beta-lactamase class C family)